MDLLKSAARILEPEINARPEEVHEVMTQLRKDAPVAWVEPHDVRPVWLVSRAADVKFVETNPDKFIAKPRPALLTISEEQNNLKMFGNMFGPMETLVNMDGDLHRSRRMFTQSWFQTRNIKAMRESVEATAKTYIDRMAEIQPECDFAKDVAFLYPLRVINSLMGLGEEFDAPILKLTQQNFGSSDADMGQEGMSSMELMAAAWMEFDQLMKPVIQDRRANPRKDLATALATATDNGELLPDAEIMGYFIIVATAGHDTTSGTTAGGMLELIRHPEQLQKLKDNPELIPNAVEEFFRWTAPVKHFFRTATEDVEVGGQMIREGESVAVLFASACRDEAVFENPHTFNIERKPNPHLAFGTGPHLCLGMHLARLEIASFFRQLLPRLDKIDLNGDPSFVQASFVTGVKSLPIKYSMQ